jgi:hypothetical protein
MNDPRKDAVDRQAEALDRNTQSNYKLSESLDQVTKEVRGIGDRARSAIPDMWSGMSRMQQMEQSRAIALGAFGA